MEGTIRYAMRTIPHLTLVPGGLRDAGRIGSTVVRVTRDDDPTLRNLTVVHEEDTHLVLSAPSIVHEIEHHPIRVIDAVWNDAPRVLGGVVERPGALLAIVHDLSLEPTTRADWIRMAAERALDIADRRALRRLVFQPLGSIHGRITTSSAVDLILEAIAARSFVNLETVVIRVDGRYLQSAEAALGRWLAKPRANG